MKETVWRVEYITPPRAVRYCKKCGVKAEFESSGLFRVNAQQKYIDIWLIYKCERCDCTWNLTVYSRVNPKRIPAGMLEKFYSNDEDVAARIAMDINLLRSNGAEATPPGYEVVGEDIDFSAETELRLLCGTPSNLKVSSVLRAKMGLSRKAFEKMLDDGQIRCVSGHDLKKALLTGEIIVVISG